MLTVNEIFDLLDDDKSGILNKDKVVKEQDIVSKQLIFFLLLYTNSHDQKFELNSRMMCIEERELVVKKIFV